MQKPKFFWVCNLNREERKLKRLKMSKIIYTCLNNQKLASSFKRNLELISDKIMPDNITALPPKIVKDKGIIFGIFNPNDLILLKDNSVCLGSIFEKENQWWKPVQKYPDGSYALFRGNDDCVEIVSDVVASRTIWYFKNEELFIASTSQRAIINLIKSFKFNESVIPWMLCNGNLGPFNSWDSRIEFLPGDSSLILNRKSWTLTKKVKRADFSTLRVSDEKHEDHLRQALTDTFESIDLDYSKWVLALSGGIDSRAILCNIKKNDKLKTITWGSGSSFSQKNNDAFVAKSLADFFHLQHKYYKIDLSDEPLESIFNRFLICGEGRVDHISAYMDGFEMWKILFENGVHGVIRGDQGFGWYPVLSPRDVRRTIAFSLWSDFSNLISGEKFGFAKQELPNTLVQREDESLETWRDRMQHQIRHPLVLAALNDLKSPYVEIINPLVSRKIIYQVRKLPVHLRTGKFLHRKIVRTMSPRIDLAKVSATGSSKNIFKSKQIIDFLREELSSNYVYSILPKEFINYIFDNVETVDNKNSKRKKTIKDKIKGKMPKKLKNILINTVLGQRIDFNALAFRAYIICSMNKILTEDVRRFD